MKKTLVSICFIFGFIINAFYQRNLVATNKVAQISIPSSLKELSELEIINQPADDEAEGYGKDVVDDNLIQPVKPKATKSVVTPKPTPTPEPTQVPVHVPVVNQGKYKNGTYTGSQADASYGIVQVEAIITNGNISNIKFLSYPNDRQHSVQVSNYAMPILKQEAIAAQSQNVDTVSGASYTSAAFIESLGGALAQAM